MTHYENPQMDLEEVISTLNYISEQESKKVDCTALREYLTPILNAKRINLESLNTPNETI